jgi:cytochrome c5
MSLQYPLATLLLLSASLVPLQAMPKPRPQAQPAQQAAAKAGKKQTAAAKSSVHQDEGQRVFEQNCSRCHAAPDGFSPRISGTVVRHMRARASLSQHDEQELLRFLNP